MNWRKSLLKLTWLFLEKPQKTLVVRAVSLGGTLRSLGSLVSLGVPGGPSGHGAWGLWGSWWTWWGS